MTKAEFQSLDNFSKYYLFMSSKETISIQNGIISSLELQNENLENKLKELQDIVTKTKGRYEY